MYSKGEWPYQDKILYNTRVFFFEPSSLKGVLWVIDSGRQVGAFYCANTVSTS